MKKIMKASTLNRIGLLFSIAGVILMFIFAPPQPDHNEGFGIGLEDNTILSDGKTVVEHEKEISERRKKYGRNSKVALGLIGIGFCFQLGATFCKD